MLGVLPAVAAEEPQVCTAVQELGVVLEVHPGTLSRMGVGGMTSRMAAVVAAAVLALLAASSSRAATPSLYFHYAADCTFSIVDDNHNTITTLPPGTYQVVVDSPFAF